MEDDGFDGYRRMTAYFSTPHKVQSKERVGV